jgi:uncharacterized phage protein (TIGR02218 family)
MSDDFLIAESAPEGSLARELYQVTMNNQAWYFNSGVDDFIFAAVIHTAEPTARSSIVVPTAKNGSGDTLEVQIRIDHPLVKRWFQLGIPPKSAYITVIRYQELNGTSERVWKGEITFIKTSGRLATVTVSGYFGVPMKKRLPTITVARTCPHILYDSRCRVDPTAFEVTATVLSFDGQVVRIDIADSAKVTDWALYGTLQHVPTGEYMTVGKQAAVSPSTSTKVDLTLQAAIVGMKAGDQVKIRAGCAHDIITCENKFSNRVNFGGFPSLPKTNPFTPTGFGIVEQA